MQIYIYLLDFQIAASSNGDLIETFVNGEGQSTDYGPIYSSIRYEILYYNNVNMGMGVHGCMQMAETIWNLITPNKDAVYCIWSDDDDNDDDNYMQLFWYYFSADSKVQLYSYTYLFDTHTRLSLFLSASLV